MNRQGSVRLCRAVDSDSDWFLVLTDCNRGAGNLNHALVTYDYREYSLASIEINRAVVSY